MSKSMEIDDILQILRIEGCNPKYIKKDKSNFPRTIEFETKYRKYWIEWEGNIPNLCVGDLYSIRIPFTHMEARVFHPSNRRCLCFYAGQGGSEVILTLEKLIWPEEGNL